MATKILLTVLALAWLSQAFAAEPRKIKAQVGEEFKIELESDSSSGCQWLLYKPLNEKLLKQTGKTYQRVRGKPGTTAGVEILKYRALAEGQALLYLKYDRLWEKTAAPLRVTNFLVVISPPKQ